MDTVLYKRMLQQTINREKHSPIPRYH